MPLWGIEDMFVLLLSFFFFFFQTIIRSLGSILFLYQVDMEYMVWKIDHEETKTHALQSDRDLRFILTQSCNYACWFCHKERMNGDEKELLSVDDYGFIYDVAQDNLAIGGATLTGWEPLMRKDIVQIAKQLKEKKAFVSMVSNGKLLQQKKDVLDHIDRLNVSLHTTNPTMYSHITQTTHDVADIMQQICAIKHSHPHIDIRINATLVQDLQPREEIIHMIHFALSNNLNLKYLELCWASSGSTIPLETVIPLLEDNGFAPVGTDRQQLAFQRWASKVMLRKSSCDLAQQLGEGQAYCKKNADINISPDGKWSVCLLDTKRVDLLSCVQQRDSKTLAHLLHLLTSDISYACCIWPFYPNKKLSW